jgi:hypothetical protein
MKYVKSLSSFLAESSAEAMTTKDWATENPELERIRLFGGSVKDMHTWMAKKLKEQGMDSETNPYKDVQMVNGPQRGQKDKSLPYQDFQNGESDLVKNRHNGQ